MTGVLIELLMIYWNIWNLFTVWKRMSLGLFKNIINKMFLKIIYEDLALNNLQCLIYYQTKLYVKC